MIDRKFNSFYHLFVYKNFLTRKRRWVLSFILQLVIPLLWFLTLWLYDGDKVHEKVNLKSEIYEAPKSANCKVHLFFVPNNRFTLDLAERMHYCLIGNIRGIRNHNISKSNKASDNDACRHVDVEKNRFNSEDDMMRYYEPFYPNEREQSSYAFSAAIIFNNDTAYKYKRNFAYTMKIPKSLPKELYARSSYNPIELNYEKGYAAIQMCAEEELIKMKKGDPDFNFQIDLKEMESLRHIQPDVPDEALRAGFCGIILFIFLITLCIETSFVSNEKTSGINMLLSVHNVSYCLNLLSWLLNGLIYTLFLTVPIVILSKYFQSEHVLPILQYGNPFIFWIMLTLNMAHHITFGMHVSSYFNKPSFAVIGVFVLWLVILIEDGIKENTFGVVPFIGIIFPNFILQRTLEEFLYYERLERTYIGLTWYNMFDVGYDAYGVQGSVGVMLFLSILGIIFHFAMANYVYAINPGKYGIRKSPFSFVKFFKKLTNSNDYDKVEDVEFTGSNNKLFESVQKDSVPEIQVRKLTKTHRIGLLNGLKKCALKDLSIDFFEKQTTVLLGYSGSGKTSLLSILTGSISPSEGLVLVNGKNVMSQSDEIINNIGYCPQEDVLFPHLSVNQHLRFFNMLKNPNKSRTLVGVEVRSLLGKLQLLHKRTTLPGNLTKAEKRKLCLGIALIGNPKILILDEPTLGLNAEEKRHIWNVLLKMNTQNTILIGTRDTEEANVLGDSVAMLHEGELKCYGSPNYLKKLLGHENLQITLDTESQSELEKICEYFDPESEVIGINHERVILSVPDNDELPNSLDKIELNKEELGITGINVSNFTLEKVYLEATYDNSAPLASREPSCSTVDKLDNDKHSGNSLKALLYKKATYTANNYSTIIIILIMFFLSLLCASLVLISQSTYRKTEIPIKLDMYGNIPVYYNYDGAAMKFLDVYENYRKPTDWRSIKSQNYYIFQENINTFEYAYRDLVAARFELYGSSDSEIRATALYNSARARYSIPVSINLVSNAAIKGVFGSDASIDVSYGELPQFKDNVNVENLTKDAKIEGYIVAVILILFIFPAVAFFVVHPLRESLSNVKRLQRISGVSALGYWTIIFIFDFLILLLISILFVGKFVATDFIFNLNLFRLQESAILLLLLVLFALNALPFVYLFSFRKKSASSTIVLLSLVPIFLVLVDLTISVVKLYLCEDNKIFNTFRYIQKGIFLIVPYVSFFHGQVSFFNDMRINAECRKVSNWADQRMCERSPCCNFRCYRGSCTNAVPYFKNFKDDIALETSVLAMCLTPLLYFSLLLILEYKLIPKLLARIRAYMPSNTDVAFEENVKRVKHEIAFEASKVRENVSAQASKNGSLINVENGMESSLLVGHERKDYEFFVYELRILEGNFAVVEDVSFGVQFNECFGILGASGAGKTAILKVITGEKMPKHGMIHLRGEPKFEGMGYCPQNSALIKSLSANDHLRLFARLRGVPERKVEREVIKWIDRLNLTDCASQPSETYSNGNKKRLNIAMALIGHPKLVVLDEPTKNLDPATKQSLWKIIQSCQIGQATILTTESMEECLTLCKSFAIMADGRFTDIGACEDIKQRIRTGYEVRFQLKYETTKDEINALKKEMSCVLPCGGLTENPGFLKFHISPTEKSWRQMYDLLMDVKEKHPCVEEFHILTSSLAQFLSTRLEPVNEEKLQKH